MQVQSDHVGTSALSVRDDVPHHAIVRAHALAHALVHASLAMHDGFLAHALALRNDHAHNQPERLRLLPAVLL